MLIFVTAVSVALVVSFLCSIFESVLLSIRPAQVEALVSRGRRSGGLLKTFKERMDVPIAAILIVNTIAHTIGATVAGAYYVDVFSAQSLWLFSIIFTTAVLLLTEIIPKTLGVTYTYRLASPVAHAIHWLTVVLRPLVVLSEAISRGIRGRKDVAQVSAEEIRLLTALARSEGALGVRTAGIIERATRLSQLRAVDIMLPRNQVRIISPDKGTAEIIQWMRSPSFSRYPFSPTGQLDDVTGIVMAKELLFSIVEKPGLEPDWNKLMREPLFMPEVTSLNSLLKTFMAVRRHLAIVVDEYGDTTGIVTMEDVLEELVGDIEDESDHHVEELREQADGSINALATVDMRKLCANLGLDWEPEEAYSTLGGLMADSLERVPAKGDVIHWRGFRLEVLKASETRTELINISHVPGVTA